MDESTVKSRIFFTAIINLLLGFFVATLLNTSSTNEQTSKLNQSDAQLRSLEIKLSNIDDYLHQLIDQNKSDNLILKIDSADDESITSANLKNILKEIIHEEFNVNKEQNIADNEDTSKAWELISQAQATEITVDFFQSEEINALPAKQKEMVISEIVGMMNRGEIDADKFFGVE